MEDVKGNDIVGSNTNFRGPIREASSTVDEEYKNLIYGREHFRKDKARRRYDFYNCGRRIVAERGVDVVDLDARAPRVREVLDPQGWTGHGGRPPSYD